MHAAYVLVALVSAGAPRGADLPREPGVYWEQTAEMQVAGGFSMPPQTTKVCMPRKQDWTQPPQHPEGGQQDCKLTDVKRSGQKLTWKLTCGGGMSGEGEMTWTADAYAGRSTMRTPAGELKMSMKGRKLGGDCDANESRRAMASTQEEAAQQQAATAEAIAQSCEAAVDGMDARTIATLPQCKAKKAAFCKRLETREGLAIVLDQGEPAKGEAAKLCGKDLARVQAALCPAAAKEYARGGPRGAEALVFIGTSCPAEAAPIARRECAGRSYTDLEGTLREFCTAYARRGLDQGEPDVQPARAAPPEQRPAPAEAEPAPGGVEQGKKILKGLFGR